MTIIDRPLDLSTQTEGAAPTLPSSIANTGSGSQLEARAAHAFAQTYGLLLPTMASSFRRLEYTLPDGGMTSGTRVLSFALKPITFSSSATYVASFVNGTTGQCDLRINNSGATRTFTLRNIANSNALQAGTVTFATNTAVRAELSVTIGGNIEARIYTWGTSTLLETITLAATNITQVTKAYMGVTAAASGYSAAYGDVQYADTWTGPYPSANEVDAPFVLNLGGEGVLPPGPVELLPYPAYAAHRGGAGIAGRPENALYSYEQVLANDPPRTVLETDCYLLTAGGGYTTEERICLTHEGGDLSAGGITVEADGSTVVTGATSSKTVEQWDTYLIKPTTGTPRPASRWVQIVDLLLANPSRIAMPEMKETAVVQPLIDSILARGLVRQTIVQGFGYGHCTTAAAAGLNVLWLTTSFATNSAAAAYAAGIRWVGTNVNLSGLAAFCSEAHAAGLKVWAYTANTVTDRNTAIAAGVDAIFTDRPDIVSPPRVDAGFTLHLSSTGVASSPEVVTRTASFVLDLSGDATAVVPDAAPVRTASFVLDLSGVFVASSPTSERDVTVNSVDLVQPWKVAVMPSNIDLVAGSVEYLKVTVSADVALTQQVEIGIGQNAASAEWHAATWQGAAGASRVASALIDTSTLDATHSLKVYVRITDNPEKVVRTAGALALAR